MHPNLYYIIGASGCGKDSLMTYARNNLSEDAKVVFAHRYITRNADAGNENHVALSEQEFSLRLNHGFFAMHWHSHGYHYGIGDEVNDWLDKGFNVVVNGSREYLNQAARDFGQLLPVSIEVDLPTLQKRLESRGRESGAEIAQRLQRAKALSSEIYHPRLVRIHNNKTLEESGKLLLSILSSRN